MMIRSERVVFSTRRLRMIMLALLLVTLLGSFIYSNIWISDHFPPNVNDFNRSGEYEYFYDDSELYDVPIGEGADEMAEWKLRFEEEVDKHVDCLNDLSRVKEALEEKTKKFLLVSESMTILEGNNLALQRKFDSLKDAYNKMRSNNSSGTTVDEKIKESH